MSAVRIVGGEELQMSYCCRCGGVTGDVLVAGGDPEPNC